MPDRRLAAAAALALAVVLAGSASAGPEAELAAGSAALEVYDPLFLEDEAEEEQLEHDPFEGANRMTFAFNQQVDYFLLDPLTRGYQWLVPGPVRRGVNRVFDNLNSPVVFANQVLQVRPRAAGQTLTRFVVNSTLGVAGVFDVGEEVMGMRAIEADFGQTLARYRVPRGPYLVVPLIGPSTTRDAFGTAVDIALDPLTYIVGPFNFQWQLILGSGQGLALRDANLDALDALRDASVDFYSALRSAYLQTRRAKELEVQGPQPAPETYMPAAEPPPETYMPAAEPGLEMLPDANEVPALEEETSLPAAIPEVEELPESDPAEPADQELAPEASLAIRSSMAEISASKSSRFTMPENSDLRSASSLTVPSR